jgi:hypothetical protein
MVPQSIIHPVAKIIAEPNSSSNKFFFFFHFQTNAFLTSDLKIFW